MKKRGAVQQSAGGKTKAELIQAKIEKAERKQKATKKAKAEEYDR